jgi:hypothetical protein
MLIAAIRRSTGLVCPLCRASTHFSHFLADLFTYRTLFYWLRGGSDMISITGVIDNELVTVCLIRNMELSTTTNNCVFQFYFARFSSYFAFEISKIVSLVPQSICTPLFSRIIVHRRYDSEQQCPQYQAVLYNDSRSAVHLMGINYWTKSFGRVS